MQHHRLATCSHLVCILEDKLAFKWNAADALTEWSCFCRHQERKKKDLRNQSQVGASSQTTFNELLSFLSDISSSYLHHQPPTSQLLILIPCHASLFLPFPSKTAFREERPSISFSERMLQESAGAKADYKVSSLPQNTTRRLGGEEVGQSRGSDRHREGGRFQDLLELVR